MCIYPIESASSPGASSSAATIGPAPREVLFRFRTPGSTDVLRLKG